MEIAAFVLSIISFLASFICFFIERKLDKKINNINLQSHHFSVLFDKILLEDIPNARKMIIIDYRHKLIGFEGLQKCIVKLRRNCLIYYYMDKKFYDKVDKAVQDLEDYLIYNSSKILEAPQSNKVEQNIDQKVKQIYDIMFEKFLKG